MTNWMTVTGVAMILGGAGIPIWFRREIFGVGGKRRVRASRGQRAIEAPRRAQLTAAPAHAAEVPALVDKPPALSAAPTSGPPGTGPTATRRFRPARTAASQADAAEDVSVLEVAAPGELESPEAEAAGSSRRSRRGRRRALTLAGTAAAAGTEPRAGTETGRRPGAAQLVETESGAGQRLGGESGAGLGQRTETPEGRRRGTAAGSGQRRRGWTAVRDAGDDLDDRDSTGRFRYGLASIGLADDEISPADEDISPAQDDMGPADDDIDSAGDGHDISRADTGGHGGGLAGAGGQARSVSSSALPKLPTPALAAHGAGQAVEGGYDEAYAAGDRAVHHDVEADRDDHDQHEVGRVEDESPDVSDITGEAAAEAPAGLVGPDGHYLDDREHYLQEPDELNHAEHPGGADQRERAAPPAMPRTWGDRRYGDRVDGWVRPHYHELPRSEGAYWTPVPEAAQYNGPFGWPIPVDRLPAVPDYEPATGFDLTPVGEPTAVVTQWPPSQPAMQWPPAQPASRLEQPRSWSMPGGAMAAQEQSFWVAPDEVEEDDRRPRRRAVMIRRGRAEPKRRGAGDPTQALPSIEHEANDQRPRPRPRPSTVYVSKHAAE